MGLRRSMTQFPGDSRGPVSSDRRGVTVKGIASAVVSRAAVVWVLWAGVFAHPARPEAQVLGFVDSDRRFAVQGAVDGAAARLSRPSCQDVLSDFADESGQSLRTTPLARGSSPAKTFSALRFVDSLRHRNAALGPPAPSGGHGENCAITPKIGADGRSQRVIGPFATQVRGCAPMEAPRTRAGRARLGHEGRAPRPAAARSRRAMGCLATFPPHACRMAGIVRQRREPSSP